jgi:hypothetical protein
MNYPGFEPGTFWVAVSIANHYSIWVVQGVQAQPLSLDEKCKKLEETIQREATNTIGYTRKQANKEWSDEECTMNAAIPRGNNRDWATWRWSIQNSRKFYKRLNDVRRPFEPQVAMSRSKNGKLLTNKNQVLARWKDHYEEHLNEDSESEQPTVPVDLRDNGVDIDLLSREEIERAPK